MQKKASESNKRIVRNTLLLYCRTFLIMIISLYTSRIILDVLGIEDYGIYNVVGGVVAMFSIISSTFSAAISRFITYELGKNDSQRLKVIFSTSINIQFILSFLVVVLGEIIGLWFINYKMQIPIVRLNAANWVFQCSLLTFVINLISVPYNACIIAHEQMKAFAFISILEVILKLTIVYSLLISPFDKLITYAILLVIVGLFIRIIYGAYCKQHFPECTYHLIYEKKILKEMLSFAGWSFLGNSVYILNTQGINILINIFFGVVLNAARGISTQIEGAILQFVNNFTMAINPQITKSYAAGEKEYVFTLICQGAKYSYILLLFFVIPFFLETESILSIWLKKIPTYTAIFIKLSCLCILINSLGNSIITAISATGKIKTYHICITIISILIFPLTWLAYKNGLEVYSSYIIYLIIYIFLLFVRLKILKDLINFPIEMFIRKTLVRIFFISIISIIVPIMIQELLDTSLLRVIMTTVSSTLSIIISTYLLGLEPSEKVTLKNKIRTKIIHYRLH